MSSDIGGGIIIVRNNLKKPAFFGEAVPADGIGKFLGKVKVWHLIVIAFVLGAVINSELAYGDSPQQAAPAAQVDARKLP